MYKFKGDELPKADMIAIAGSKGGCGKTTVTLGLAGAFARAERPSLAIDADRQLPDLHVMAGIDREPTIANLDDADDPGTLAQTIPGLPGVSVLPGPKPAESVDIQRALEHLNGGQAQMLVDCPSGTGPDLTDPLLTADRVVVVTTTDGQSIKDTRTTVDIARRLDVPVEGVIVTMADTAPESIESKLDVPVLATVPESETPLSDAAVAAAFDEAADRLLQEGPVGITEESDEPVDPTGTRVQTGLDSVDRAVGGGLKPGSIMALVAEPASQAEQYLHRMTTTRGTLYLSTDRSESLVRDALATDAGETGSPAVRTVDPQNSIDDAIDLLGDLPDGSNLIVDTANTLEEMDRDAYLQFLTALKERMISTDSVALLHCLDTDRKPANRHLTERVADAVVSISVDADEESVSHRATVRKFRSDPSATGVISLDFED